MVITDIGQIGIKTPSGFFTLTPSLRNIASLENPTESYKDICDPNQHIDWRFEVACKVMLACSDSPDLAKYLGMQPLEKPRIRKGVKTTRYQPSYVPARHCIIFAEHLLFHGMVGKIDNLLLTKESDYTDEFKPLSWVAAVVAHLGIPEREAWQMTMTSILHAMRVKYPPSEKQKALATLEEDKKQFDDWYQSIYGAKK